MKVLYLTFFYVSLCMCECRNVTKMDGWIDNFVFINYLLYHDEALM